MNISIHNIEKIERHFSSGKVDSGHEYKCMTLEITDDKGQSTQINLFSDDIQKLKIMLNPR